MFVVFPFRFYLRARTVKVRCTISDEYIILYEKENKRWRKLTGGRERGGREWPGILVTTRSQVDRKASRPALNVIITKKKSYTSCYPIDKL